MGAALSASGVVLFTAYLVRWRRPAISERFRHIASQSITVRFDETGVETRRGGAYTRTPWSQFVDVGSTPAALFLELPWSAMIVPRRAVTGDDDAWEAFVSEARRLYDAAVPSTAGPLLRDTRGQ